MRSRYRRLISERRYDYAAAMGTLVNYELTDSVAAITMDDGKVNVMSLAMQTGLHEALDRAEADGAVVLLRGRDGVFSAGFDLAVLRAGGPDALAMAQGGFELARRVLAFPQPVVVACTGHAVAMGAFLLLSGDYRVGAAGPYKFAANEVAIGLTLPAAAIEVLRARLTPSAFSRAAILAETFSPENAVEAGFLDRVVPDWDVAANAREVAAALSTLDRKAHAATKLRARHATLTGLRAAIDDLAATELV
jgi:enoyl-CoA hydratase